MRRAAAALLCLAALGAVAADDVRDVGKVPGLRDRGREAYAAFLAAQPARAFALDERGNATGWRGGEKERGAAIAGALFNCNKIARNVCKLYAVDDEVVFPRYAEFDQKSAKAREGLRGESFAFADYGDEVREYPAGPTDSIRVGAYHAGTPMRLEGARTVKTVELARMLASAVRPILVDVLEGAGHETLPGAYWIRGAGLGLDQPAANADIQERLGLVLQGITGGDKGALLAFFCLDAECWLSYNAALRARSLGYTNILWYRGGVKAWRAARLETLESVQHAQVR